VECESDADAIGRSIAEPEYFAVLFDQYAALLLRFFIRRAGPAIAEELVGESFRIAFERRASFDQAYESARPWLYGIAGNVLAKHRRSEGRRLHAIARLAADRVVGGAEDDVIAAVDARASMPLVARAVAALPDGERDALLLFAWEELTYHEIAVALGVPVGTVRSRINRARGRLRAISGRDFTTTTKGQQRG
jgi:RNA polymerase sigma factor (sigma-70 family)